MTKYILFILLALSFILPAQALAEENGRTLLDQAKDKVKDMQQENRPASQSGSKLKNARLMNAKVMAISGATITISFNNQTITVNTTGNTQFRRLFWGKSQLSEIAVNDMINVWGTWTDDNHTTLTAIMIRDLSIQKFRGVFFGSATSVTSTGMVLSSKNRGNQTVTYGSTTKFINRTGGAITAADIKANDTVRIRGVWDKTNKTITEVTEVKDFSIPQHGVVSPIPSQ